MISPMGSMVRNPMPMQSPGGGGRLGGLAGRLANPPKKFLPSGAQSGGGITGGMDPAEFFQQLMQMFGGGMGMNTGMGMGQPPNNKLMDGNFGWGQLPQRKVGPGLQMPSNENMMKSQVIPGNRALGGDRNLPMMGLGGGGMQGDSGDILRSNKRLNRGNTTQDSSVY